MTKEELLDEVKNSNYVFPTLYSNKEGGELKLWKFDPVEQKDLKQRDTEVVIINLITVHSLIFKNDEIEIRWDCINGFND